MKKTNLKLSVLITILIISISIVACVKKQPSLNDHTFASSDPVITEPKENLLSANDYDRAVSGNYVIEQTEEVEKDRVHVEQEAFKLISKFESFSKKAYICPGGKKSIGYGFGYKNVKHRTITKQQADQILVRKINEYNRHLDRVVKIELTPKKRVALLSLIYNIGVTQFDKSTLLKHLNKNRINKASKQFSLWVYAKHKRLAGLVLRREAERRLFNHMV